MAWLGFVQVRLAITLVGKVKFQQFKHFYVLVNVRLRVHYGNYWTKGCGREANTARASAASECCIRLETKPLSPIFPVVYERKPYINWFVVHIWSSFEFC